MTKIVEVLDALMGSGKTHAIIKYMSEHQDQPWLYISPMLDETERRVPDTAQEFGMDMFVPQESSLTTKSENCLLALEQGLNICCTHNLMYKFTKKHLEMIELQNYRVVSDEELNLINGYSISKWDSEHLIRNNLISVGDDGLVSFLDEEMSLNARYGDVKAKADLGMLYASDRSSRMLVTQLSPKLIDAASKFILLTYNYKDSIMQTFLKMHGYEYFNFGEVSLYKTEGEIRENLLKRINFIETPSVKKIQDTCNLSKYWWERATKEKRGEVAKAMNSCKKSTKTTNSGLFYTVPKDYAKASTGFNTKYIGGTSDIMTSDSTFVACNARSTNVFENKTLAMHGYNLFPNQSVKAFIQGRGHKVHDDIYALNMLLQWLWRGCVRKKDGDEKMNVVILSKRMSVLFKEWLTKNQ